MSFVAGILNNKENYQKPNLKVINFDFQDIITTSCSTDGYCPGAHGCQGYICDQNVTYDSGMFNSDIYSGDPNNLDIYGQ